MNFSDRAVCPQCANLGKVMRSGIFGFHSLFEGWKMCPMCRGVDVAVKIAATTDVEPWRPLRARHAVMRFIRARLHRRPLLASAGSVYLHPRSGAA